MGKRNRNFKLAAVGALLCANACISIGLAVPVNAANGWDIDLNAGGDEAEASSVTISLGTGTSSVTLNAKNPSKLQGMIKKTANVTIGATDGYTIKVSGNPNLTSGGNTIQGVSSVTTLNQMSNRWGWYYVDGNTNCSESASYKGMSSAGETVGSGELVSTTTKTITMCFGAKIDASQPGGNYSNTVVISAVAQPKTIATFGGITTMQEMTADICKAASENDTAYLRDVRDNKSYWVTKLKDGNCWMSQNLDLDITTSNIKATNSDVTSDWNSASALPPQATGVGITANLNQATGASSWDLGLYVLNTPVAMASCGDGVYQGLNVCSGQGFVNVGSRRASSDPNFYRKSSYFGTDGSNCTKNANTAISTATSGACAQYDAHYLVGNYYQWNAAVAGTGVINDKNITNTSATGSVCPKGWKLADSGNNTTSGTFGRLLSQYGVSGSLTGSNGGYTYNIALSPLFFMRGGYLDPGSSNYLRYAGKDGLYWSSRVGVRSDLAVALLFDESRLNPSEINNYYTRSEGLSIRCLVPAA